ncbi:hypothetical protein LSCM1_07739 [Leishmania martiniquensis]|uniref:Ubiquitin-like domain-containing protein n=1 Tax=Leishmania martiniquensis TaxID=1580590 RepID=A0A836KTX5_9TRYP|nr:hypothetical protein LSCM1_07739 [Leishmania martiniquensis]
MAPDAARDPPAELQGPPRYLRARGLTPSPSAVAARRRASRERQQPGQDGRRRQSSAAQTVAQPPDAISNGSQSRKTDESAAPPDPFASSQPSGLSQPPLPNHRDECPGDSPHSSIAEQEAQRQDCASPTEEWRGAVALSHELERSARAPPPRSRSPASRRASSLCSCRGPTVAGMVLAVPQLSPAHATANDNRRPIDPATASGVPPQPALGKRHRHHRDVHSQRPPATGIDGRLGVPGQDAVSEATLSAARRATSLFTSPPLMGTSPIARSYVVPSPSSYLGGDATVLFGVHHRRDLAPSCVSPSLPLSSSRAFDASTDATAATSMAVARIAVAVVAAAAPSLPEPEVLERYEDMLRFGLGGCGVGEPRRNGDGDARQAAPQCYTAEELSAAFDLVVHIRLANAATATVSDIKGEVERCTGLPATQQCLVYDAMSLQNCLPLHLLLFAVDEGTDSSPADEREVQPRSDGSVGGERDAITAAKAAYGCLRLVCVPLSSDSAAATTMTQQTRQIESPPRAAGSLAAAAAAADTAALPPRSTAPATGIRHDSRRDDETAAPRSLLLMPHVSPNTRASSAAAAASLASPLQRPDARPFTLSHDTSAAASAMRLASKGAASASPVAATDEMERVVSEHINRLRRLYLSDAEMGNESSRVGSASAVVGMRRGPEHAEPLSTAASTVGARRDRDRFSPLSAAAPVPSRAYRSAMMDGSSHPTIGVGPLPHRAVLSEVLVAALPAPPARRPVTLLSNGVASATAGGDGTCVPRTSVEALSWKPSELQTQPMPQTARPVQTTASSGVDADVNAGNSQGGVDASWISSLSMSSSSTDDAAAAVLGRGRALWQ